MGENTFGRYIRLKHLLSVVKDTHYPLALEVGCDTGLLLKYVLATTKIGYDVAPVKVYDDIHYITMDVNSQRHFQQHADIIICAEVLEHIKNDKLLLESLYDSLRVGGLIFITTLNSNIKTDKSVIDKERGHLRRYDRFLFKKNMEKLGFSTIDCYGFRSPHYYEAKKGLVPYKLQQDIIESVAESSGLVYVGIKRKLEG